MISSELQIGFAAKREQEVVERIFYYLFYRTCVLDLFHRNEMEGHN